MPSFRFLHAADIHLDSPLIGLARYEGLPVDEIRAATRAAFDNLIDFAVAETVDFVIIAGDLFDGEWRDMAAGLYFAKAVGRLDRAGIPTFILNGNHDAESVITRAVPWPPCVRMFGSKRPETHELPDLAVAVHGQSFRTAAETDNLALAYPTPVPHCFNIGVLHTALGGMKGHLNYAPCSVADLLSKNYQYWALGHVHEYGIVSDDPYIVFAGNVQGRNIRETGSKGAVLVTVIDGEVTAVESQTFDVMRWVHLAVDCGGAEDVDIGERFRTELIRMLGANAAGRPLIMRVSLTGELRGAGLLLDRVAELRDELRAIAVATSADVHLEKVRVLVSEPRTEPNAMLPEGLDALIDEAATDPELLALIASDLERFLLASGALLPLPEEGELRHLAAGGEWPAVLYAGAAALRSRLARAG